MEKSKIRDIMNIKTVNYIVFPIFLAAEYFSMFYSFYL